MIYLSLEEVEKAAESKPTGYLGRMIELSEQVDGHFHFTRDNFLLAVREFSPEKYESVRRSLGELYILPLDQWPLWAKALKSLSTDEDTGVGDTVARLIGEPTSSRFKAWHKFTFGVECNCASRQATWNLSYPYRMN